jgi:hypothetical protein
MIDLDAIINTVTLNDDTIHFTRKDIKSLMKVAIHQALVLACENARTKTQGNSDGYEYWEFEVVDGQSILDVEKFIQ